jgi:hypothetical protein
VYPLINIAKKIMLSIRCKDCNKELIGHPTKTVSCGCPNMATICGDKISAVDLSRVIMLNSPHTRTKIKCSFLSRYYVAGRKDGSVKFVV